MLSKSTLDYDQNEKFKHYRSIADLQEYVLINQYQVEVQQYTKTNDGFWLYRAYESIEETVSFDAIATQITLAEIYEGIEFE